MSDQIFRIIGPSNNRLLTVINSATLKPGQIRPEVAQTLMRECQWRPYSGPGRAVNGWLVAGSDPNHTPRTLKAK